MLWENLSHLPIQLRIQRIHVLALIKTVLDSIRLMLVGHLVQFLTHFHSRVFIALSQLVAIRMGLHAVTVIKVNSLPGDLNSDNTLTTADAVLLQRYLLQERTLTQSQWQTAELNADGTVNGFDLALLRQKLVG